MTLSADEMLYELKGDKLGMTLEEFKQKYERSGEGGTRLPLCSDTAWGANKASLRTEPWHQRAGIIHARIDLPSENNSPTVAGVKSELMLYEFVDGKLFRIAAWLPTDKFHLVSEAAISKYGPVSRNTKTAATHLGKPNGLGRPYTRNGASTRSLGDRTCPPPAASTRRVAHPQRLDRHLTHSV